MKKIVLIALIGLVLFTACDENKKQTDSILETTATAKVQDDVIRLDDIDISSIKIKNLTTNDETILLKDGIIKEFCSLLSGIKYNKTDESWEDMSHEAEILVNGDTVLKINMGAWSVSVNRKVAFGDTVMEQGTYEAKDSLQRYIEKYFEGTVLDPQYIEPSAKLVMPQDTIKAELSDMGSSKINRYELQESLFDFVKLNFSGQKFEHLEIKRIFDYDTIEKQRQDMLKKCRAIIIQYPEGYIGVESQNNYNETISASYITLLELAEKPGNYQLFTEKMIIDIKADEKFVKGFDDVFNANKVTKILKPDEIETLFNEKKPYYMEYISKNLGIEGWYGREPQELKKRKMNLDSKGETYEVLEFYNGFDLRLLIFKKDKFIDYIDFGGKQAGTENRIEKTGDKVFIVGKSCRGYGTGESRYFEDWYMMDEQGKKLVASFPYDDYYQPFYGGYTLKADSIKLTGGNDARLTVGYSVTKFYSINLDNANEYGQIEVKDTKKVVFKWDDEKSAFLSEYAPDEMGITEIPAKSKKLTEKCTAILKENYKKLTDIVEAFDEMDVYIKENTEALRYFLDDCEDCEEKVALLEMLGKV